MMIGEKEILVGYALNPKKLRKPNDSSPKRKRNGDNDESLPKSSNNSKEPLPWAGGGLADFLMNSQDSSIEFQQWNPAMEPSLQPFFHVIIHKLTEDLEKEESRDKLTALTRYLEHYPDTKLLDPLNSVRIVTSRLRTCEHLSVIEDSIRADSPFTQPKHVFLTSGPIENQCILSESRLKYPIICKPIEACGTALSHAMAVIMSPTDLHMAPQPCIAQEFIDHGGEFFKVYNIDEEVMVFKRSSLPDLGHLNPTSLKSVAFDSRHQYPSLNDFITEEHLLPDKNCNTSKTENPVCTCTCDESEEEMSKLQRKCEETAALIRKHFDLTLFGFDCLLPLAKEGSNEERKIVVVDVNYFPSYKEVVDFPRKLRSYLHRLAKR